MNAAAFSTAALALLFSVAQAVPADSLIQRASSGGGEGSGRSSSGGRGGAGVRIRVGFVAGMVILGLFVGGFLLYCCCRVCSSSRRSYPRSLKTKTEGVSTGASPKAPATTELHRAASNAASGPPAGGYAPPAGPPPYSSEAGAPAFPEPAHKKNGA